MSVPAAKYLPHRPQDTDYYHCVEDYFETFMQEYDDRFSRQYGFWRPYIEKVIYRYLDAACPVLDTGAICATALPVSDAKTAATNIYSLFPAKDGKDQKTFPAMEWLAAMCSHIPNRGEQMVRYYGYYSNVSRGKRKEAEADDVIPCILEPVENSKTFRKNWARLIQKIYEVDPLVCPHCKGTMRIISFIEDAQIIRDILTHLGLWLFRSRPPPKMRTAIILSESKTSDSYAHPPHQQADAYADPEYTWDDYIQS